MNHLFLKMRLNLMYLKMLKTQMNPMYLKMLMHPKNH
jgi:hypothetical protein